MVHALFLLGIARSALEVKDRYPEQCLPGSQDAEPTAEPGGQAYAQDGVTTSIVGPRTLAQLDDAQWVLT